MRITLLVKAALEALATVASVASGAQTIPILSFAHLAADGDALAFTTSDLGRQASASVQAKIAEPGAICVPARALSDIARNLPKDAEMALRVEDGLAKIVSGRSRFTLPTLPVDDFPVFKEDGEASEMAFDAAAFARTLECVGVAVSTEEARYYLRGVYAHAHEGVLRFVATDGHRLLRRDLAPDASGPPISEALVPAIIPAETVKDMRRLAAEAPKGAKLSFEIGARRVALRVGAARIVSKVVDGTFPDYSRVVPQQTKLRFEVETAPLALAVARGLLAAGEKGRAGALEFADGRLTLSARDPDGASASDEIDAAGETTPIRIGFNLGYLAEMTKALAGERLVFDLTDPMSPVILRNPADAATLGVLMPCRV